MSEARSGLNGIVVKGCFHTFGGEHPTAGPTGVFPHHEVYNPKTDTWTRLPDMPIPVHGVTGLVYLDGWIHLPGGRAPAGRQQRQHTPPGGADRHAVPVTGGAAADRRHPHGGLYGLQPLDYRAAHRGSVTKKKGPLFRRDPFPASAPYRLGEPAVYPALDSMVFTSAASA